MGTLNGALLARQIPTQGRLRGEAVDELKSTTGCSASGAFASPPVFETRPTIAKR